jgi:hypothetical protein
MNSLGAVDFFITPSIKGGNEYLRKFYLNIGTDENHLRILKNWIVSQSKFQKSEGIGVCHYGYYDVETNLMYCIYQHAGYIYLSVTLEKEIVK